MMDNWPSHPVIYEINTWRLTDTLTREIYGRDGYDLLQPGLFVDLEGWQFLFFK